MDFAKEIWDKTFNTRTSRFWSLSWLSLIALGLWWLTIFLRKESLREPMIGTCIILSIIIFGRILWFLCISIIKKIINKLRDSLWGNSLLNLEECQNFLCIQSANSFEEIKQAMVDTIVILKESLHQITNEDCGISIKVPLNPMEDIMNWKMKTLIRDKEHEERDNIKYQKTKHLVSINTAYLAIVNKLREGDYKYKYINLNRDEHPDYSCSSDGCYPTLPQFKSEIVCPIILPSNKKDRCFGLRGFLCIDCKTVSPFKNANYCSAMIGIIAKLLYPLLTKSINTENEEC